MTAQEYFERGKMLYEEGRYEEALESFELALRIEPENGYFFTEKASALWKLERLEEALEVCMEAIRVLPDSAKAWHRKGTILSDLKLYEKALGAFRQATVIDKNYSWPWQNMGNVYADLKDYEQALHCYDQAIQRDETDADPWHGKGNVYCDLKDYEQAFYCYDQAIQRDETNAAPWHGKGNVYHKLKDYEQAHHCYDQAIQRDDNLADPWTGKGNVYADLKEYGQALYFYEQAIQRAENDAAPWHGKGNVYAVLKDYGQALYFYDQAIQRDETNAAPWHGKGNVYADLKEYGQALYFYEQAIQRDENDAEPWHGKGNVYNNLKDYEQALHCYDQAIHRDGNFANPWYGKGIVYYDLKDYEQALYCSEQAIQRNENVAAPWDAKGIVYYNLKDYEQALYCFEQAIQRDENFANPWYGKGSVCADLKDFEQALFFYDQAIQRDENFASPWNGKGNVYADLMEYKQAIHCYNQATQRDESDALPWNGKGIVFSEVGDYESSKIAFIRAFYLEQISFSYNNSLTLFSRYPTAPFYTYRLISGHLPADYYSQWKLLIEATFEQCRNLQAYTAWLQLSGRQQKVKSWEWETWRGIVHYFMGDPVASFELFKEEVLRKRSKDLRAWYYLILSCYGFAEPAEKYMEEALEIVEEFQPAERNWLQKWIGKKEAPGETELNQRYYAGLLLYHAEKKEEALRYFQAVEKNHLPAAYMSLLIQYEKRKERPTKLLQFILKEEMRTTKPGRGFATGIYKHKLNLKREDFWTPFFQYAHYIECFKAIKLVFNSEARRKNKDFRFDSPYSVEDFWDVWSLEKEDYRRIFQLAREVRLQQETEKIFRARTRSLQRGAKHAELSPEQAEERIREQESERLLDAYEKLAGESSPERREQRLGGMISEWTLSNPDHYHTLTTALYLQELFTEQQKIMLDFYTRIQHYTRQKPSDVLFAGLKDEIKELIGRGIDLLASALDFSGALVGVFFKPLAKGALGELIIKWLKGGAAKFKTYTEFREGFLQFIGEEKERLGERFEERYPMYGFEEWVG